MWTIKEYKGNILTIKSIDKYSFDEIKEKDENIKEETKKIIDNKGTAYVLYKKNVIKLIYIFKKVTRKGKDILILNKKIILDEVKEHKAEFEKDLETEIFKITLADKTNISKIIFKNNEYSTPTIKIGKLEISVSLIWIINGILFTIMFDNFIWFIIYAIIAFANGYEVHASKQEIEKKTKKKKRTKKSKSTEEK